MQDGADPSKKPDVGELVGEQECPECHAMMPVHFGYVTWCDQCGWNLRPWEPDPPRNVVESLHATLSKKFSDDLFEEISQAESIEPALTVSKVLAFSLASLVYGLTLIFAVLGLLFALLGLASFASDVGICVIVWGIVAIIFLGFAWFARPRFPKLAEGIVPVPRDQVPTLYAIADDIAQTLGMTSVDGIVLDQSFAASFIQVGWQRKKILHLGLSLFSILDRQEKIALVAHELAHGVNGDPNRSLFVGAAIDSLAEWYMLFGFPILSRIPWLGIYALTHLLRRDSQRAEYLADYLAANVSGTEAILSLLDKLHFQNAFSLTAHRVRLSQEPKNLLNEFQQQMASVPARELERIRRVERLLASRVDVFHPPTAYRIEFLKTHHVSEPEIVLSPSDTEQLERELTAAWQGIQKKQ